MRGEWMRMISTGAALAGMLLVSNTAWAAVDCSVSSDRQCTFSFDEYNVQKAPSVFKFQARISQAKFPVGSATFSTLVVKVEKNDGAVLCQEQFSDVMVRDSVLNLEVGRMMTCELDEVIRDNSQLRFVVCIGGSDNCLKPIAMGSVPYSVKSSFANQAYKANRADLAASANYAHRVSADQNIFKNPTISTGYFDFQTPKDAGLQDALIPGEDFSPYVNDGFVEWAQVLPSVGQDSGYSRLHLCAKDLVTSGGKLKPLDEFFLHAADSRFLGNVAVDGNQTIEGWLEVDKYTAVRGGVTIENQYAIVNDDATGWTGGALIHQGLRVDDGDAASFEVDEAWSVLTGGLVIEGAGLVPTVPEGADGHGLIVYDSAAIYPKQGQDAADPTLFIDGRIQATGTGNIVGDTALGANLSVVGDAAIGGNESVGGNLTVGVNTTIGGNTAVGGTLGVTGNTTLGGTLDVAGSTDIGGSLTVNNRVEAGGGGEFGGSGYFGANLEVDGDSTLTGRVVARNDMSVAGDLTVDGAVAIGGSTVTIPSGAGESINFGKGVVFNEAVTFNVQPTFANNPEIASTPGEASITNSNQFSGSPVTADVIDWSSFGANNTSDALQLGKALELNGVQGVAAPTRTDACAGNLSWLSDGYCDPTNNNEACGWDEGDCCESTCSPGPSYACGHNGYNCQDPNAELAGQNFASSYIQIAGGSHESYVGPAAFDDKAPDSSVDYTGTKLQALLIGTKSDHDVQIGRNGAVVANFTGAGSAFAGNVAVDGNLEVTGNIEFSGDVGLGDGSSLAISGVNSSGGSVSFGSNSAVSNVTVNGSITATGVLSARGGSDVSLAASSGQIVVGTPGWPTLGIDENEIQARTGGGGEDLLFLNPHGGDVVLSNASGRNIRIFDYSDGKSIQSRNATNAANLFLNHLGGTVFVGHQNGASLQVNGTVTGNTASFGAGGFQINSDGRIYQDMGSSSYDVWIQGSMGASGGARNLAVLGVSSGDYLWVNYYSEYSGGTYIGGPVEARGNLRTTGNMDVDGNLNVDGGITGIGVRPTSCAWESDRCESDGGALIYLDRMNNLSCPSNKVMIDWDVGNCGGGQYKMWFKCCSLELYDN